MEARETRAPGAPVLAVRDLRYAYPDGHEALRGVTFHLAAGEHVALIGPNGAGKSTLMLHLNGILLAARGSVEVDGIPVDKKHAAQVRARVGLVFQDPDDQLFSPTVFDDVAFGPRHMGFGPEDVARRVTEALRMVGLSGFEQRPPHRMSLGQRKRAALATVLSMDPTVLVLDEPSAGLDPRGRRGLIDLLKTLPQTCLVSTHDMRLVAEAFPRAIVLDEGVIAADGPTAAILGDGPLLARHGLEAP